MATSNPQRPTGETCPECNNPVARTTTEHVCTECGVVLEDTPLDRGPDWRHFPSDDTNPERAYPGDPNRHDKGLGSTIGTHRERDADEQRRVRWHKHAKSDKKARGRNYATSEVERISHALELGDSLITQATALFRQAHERDDVPVKCLDTTAATCVYTVCRVHQRGLTPGDVARHARGVDGETLSRRYTRLCRALGVETPPPSAEQRVRVVASDCGLSRDTVERALAMLDSVDESDVYAGSPSTLAAAILWRVSELTQADVSDAAGVTPAGMRNRLAVLPDGQTSVSDW